MRTNATGEIVLMGHRDGNFELCQHHIRIAPSRQDPSTAKRMSPRYPGNKSTTLTFEWIRSARHPPRFQLMILAVRVAADEAWTVVLEAEANWFSLKFGRLRESEE